MDGYLNAVYVKDNQWVKKGQLLFTVDDRDYTLRAEQSNNAVISKKYNMNRLGEMYNRRHRLAGNVLSKEDVSNAGLEYAIAQADFQSSQEEHRRDELNLSKTNVYSPADGYITNLLIHAGDYVSSGKNLVSIVKDKSFYVYAYFQENEIEKIKSGLHANITLLNSKIKFSGEVESISKGIADYSNKSTQGELHNIDPTFEWVRLPMRIPVRISISSDDKNYAYLVSGMTCTVEILGQ